MPVPEEKNLSANFETSRPLRIILEKPKSQRIFDALWNALKVLFLLVLLSGLLRNVNSGETGSDIQKHYFDAHFAVSAKEFGAAEIAVISLFGEISDIAENTLAGLPGITADDLTFLLHKAAEDPDVAAILLRIDSPGGTVLAAEKISHLLVEIQTAKPVFALLEGSATSAAYYIASGARKIYAYPSTLTGNIGVIIFLPEISGLLEKIGVEMRVLTSGKFKDIGSIFRDLSPEEQEIFSGLMNESYQQFVEHVAAGRHLEKEKVQALADGRVFSGLQAEKNGLVDSTIHSFAETLELIRKELNAERVQPVEFNIPVSPWQEFLLGVQGAVPTLDSSGHFLKNLVLGPRLTSRN